MHRFVSTAAATLALVMPSPSQSGNSPAGVYGAGSPGKGGFVPRGWIAGQPSVGSKSLKLTVDHGLGGGAAGLFVSLRSARQPFLNLHVLVDLSPNVAAMHWTGILGGGAGRAGTGSAQLPVPVPNTAFLLGATFFTQWLGVDSTSASGLVASDGLRVTLSQGPLVMAGGSSLLEYVPGQRTTSQIPINNSVVDIQLDRAGTMALVSTTPTLTIYDLKTNPRKILASVSIPGRFISHVAVHPNQDRAYVILHGGTTAIVDIKRGSPTFGKSIGTVKKLPSAKLGGIGGASISADGRVLVVATIGGFVGAPSLLIIDVDPASPTRDQMLRRLFTATSGWVTYDADVSSDGKFAYACTENSIAHRNHVAKFDLISGTIVKRVFHPGRASTDIDIDPRGRFLVMANSLTSDLAFVDLTPGTNYFKVSFTTTDKARYVSVALSPDGSQAVGISPLGGVLTAFDTTTRKRVWTRKTGISGVAIAVR